MKHPQIPVLMLSLLVLAGCAKKAEEQAPTPMPATAVVEADAIKDEAVAETMPSVAPAPKPASEPKVAAEQMAVGALKMQGLSRQTMMAAPMDAWQPPQENREKYQHLTDNPVKLTRQDGVSTFSLDVDTGAYSNVRRFLKQGQLPPADAVRVEELLNYFSYDYPAPAKGHPFAVSTEVAPAPWNADHLLLRVGVKAVEAQAPALPPANLVFLVDVSGSMDSPDKLPLVQSTLRLLVDQLRPQDKVSLVVYAGRTAVELEPTPGTDKAKIHAAIARLQAGGSTAGEAAIKLAYQQARAGYIKGGINRILLATDGDFNVGVTDTEQLKDMVARERESGISLTTLGFGQGNYQEQLMEQIADVGNGNYSYIDSLDEGRKVLVEELSATFNTVAADVKLQLEFNPDQIAEWRLIGYENRVLREEDFRNDKIDAGEVGAGKSVTALYELTPVGKPTLHAPRRYGAADEAVSKPKSGSTELGFLRVRYKKPGESTSVELSQAIAGPASAQLVTKMAPSRDFRFAAAVAGFGQLLRGGKQTGTLDYDAVRKLAEEGAAEDKQGYRREFVKLVGLAKALAPQRPDTLKSESPN